MFLVALPESQETNFDWFGELQSRVKANGKSPIEFLPVLGQEGYIRKNRSHLLASYPKGGKTELVVSILLGWEDERVLYLTEEGRETWEDRAYELPAWPSEMKLVYSLGMDKQAIANEIAAWDGSVVVIDTIKILGIEDENDAAKVQAALAPIIATVRRKKQTLLFIHHDNKHGGKGGRGIAGSHAFVGIVDIFLELDEVKDEPTQRLLSGRGKIRNIQGLLYEKSETDGLMHAIGYTVVETEFKVLKAVDDSWRTTQDISDETELAPQTVLKHLTMLAKKNRILRAPPIDAVAKGKQVVWKKPG